jgi:peptide/nickel transport system permease protein
VPDLLKRSVAGLAGGALAALLLAVAVVAARARVAGGTFAESAGAVWRRETDVPLRAVLLTATAVLLVVGWVAAIWPSYHLLGTDRTGNDVLYQALKSIRTAIVIGSLATLATLPFAITFGILAGYFKGWVDDAIQYLYTVLSSIPGVLLIAAFVLMIQVWIDKNPELYETGLERADVRLLLLCVILGVTGWATLCRLLRAETLKLAELDYVQAARAFGVSHFGIMRRHIFPNLMHVVLIVAVLDFSALVLYEAVLSYVGVGVDPTTPSFGSMFNLARTEMSRDPAVWWNLLAAFLFMLALVLSANLFAGAVREAFDPRARAFRPRLARRTPSPASAGEGRGEGKTPAVRGAA